MKIKSRRPRGEDIYPPAVWRIEAWQLARQLARTVYGLTKKTKFARDFGLKGQIHDAAGLPRSIRSMFHWGAISYEL